jgi:hypothetical protein
MIQKKNSRPRGSKRTVRPARPTRRRRVSLGFRYRSTYLAPGTATVRWELYIAWACIVCLFLYRVFLYKFSYISLNITDFNPKQTVQCEDHRETIVVGDLVGRN